MQPSESTVFGGASEDPDISQHVYMAMTRPLTSARLVLSGTRQYDFMTSRVQDVEKGTEICL